MSRKRKGTFDDNVEARQKRVRSFRNRERRQQRKKEPEAADDLTWLIRIGIRRAAMKVLNERHSDVPPFWLSLAVKHGHPVSDFYPCRSHVRGDRRYYGFMFREHRDAMVLRWPKARKELTPAD